MSVLVDWLRSQLWRRKLQRELRQLEDGPVLPVAHDDLWARIAADIQHIETKGRQRPRRHVPWLLPGAMVLGLIVVTIMEPASQKVGIKSAGIEAVTLPASVLAFAIVKADGAMVRGSRSAQLHPGDAVMFYIETPGLPSDSSFQLDIQVQTPTGQRESIVDRYRIASPTETIKGQRGFILYTPDGPGTYHFHGTRHAGAIAEKLSGFSIERLDP